MVNRWFTVVYHRVIHNNGHLTLNAFISWHGRFTTVIILCQYELSKWFFQKFLSVFKGASLSLFFLAFQTILDKNVEKR